MRAALAGAAALLLAPAAWGAPGRAESVSPLAGAPTEGSAGLSWSSVGGPSVGLAAGSPGSAGGVEVAPPESSSSAGGSVDPLDPLEITWERVDLTRRALGDADGAGVLVGPWAAAPLRLRCPDGVEPRRVAISRASDGSTARVEGPFSRAVQEDGRWLLPRAPDLPRYWIEAPGCALERRRERTTSSGLARLERGQGPSELEERLHRAAPFDPERQRWLEEPAGTWLDRYLALRPPGPVGAGSALVPPSGVGSPRHLVAPGRDHAEPWWVDPEGLHWTLRGPRRLLVTARPLDGAAPCLVVGGRSSCRHPPDPARIEWGAGTFSVRPWLVEGREVGAAVTWQVLLGAGAQEVELRGAVMGRLQASWPGDFLSGRSAPDAAAIYPPGPVTPAPSPTPSALPADDPTLPDMLLWRRAPSEDRLEGGAVRWIPASGLRPGLGRWVDDEGRVTIRLRPEDAGRCVARLPGGPQFVSLGRGGVQRFVARGSPPPGAPPPRFDGCDPLVRVEEAPRTAGRALIRRHALAAGRRAGWDLSGVPQVLLLLSGAADEPLSARVTLRRADGGWERWSVEGAPSRPTEGERAVGALIAVEGGRAWTQPQALLLPEGATRVEVEGLHPLALKVRPVASAPVESAETPVEPPQGVAPTAGGGLEAVARASRALIAAQGPAERRTALRARAAALLALGALDEAWRDLERGDRDLPASLERAEDPLRSRLRRAQAEASTDGAWAADGGGFIPVGGGDPPGRLVDWAGVGDPLSVADALSRALDDEPGAEDPRPFWRAAVAGGQVLTGPQRLRAFVDAVRLGGAEGARDPAWTELRTQTVWRSVSQVTGSAQLRRARWPRSPPDPLGEALFGVPWPEARRRSVGRGWELELPPSFAGQGLRFRCRSARAFDPQPRCWLRILDGHGGVLAEAVAPLTGRPGDLQVPSLAGPGFVSLAPEDGVLAEVLLPEALGEADRTQRSWRLGAGGVARVEVLGPTVLRVETLSEQPATLSARVGGTLQRQRIAAGRDEVLIPIPASAAARVELRTDRSLLLRPSLRVQRGRSPLPPSDGALLRAAATRAQAIEASRAAPPIRPEQLSPPPEVPPARPDRSLPGTATLGLAFGTGDLARDELSLAPTWEPRLVGSLGLAARPRRTLPLWVEGRVRVTGEPERGWAALAAGGVEARLGRRLWLLRLGADGEVGGGTLNGGPLAILRGSAFARMDLRFAPAWQAVARLRVRGRARIAGDAPDKLRWVTPLLLWSHFQQEHPGQIEPSIALRWRPGPWWRLELRGELRSNSAPDPQPFDRATADLAARLLRPGGWVEASIGLDARSADQFRVAPRFTPTIGVRARWWIWPGPGVGVRLWGAVVARLAEASVAGQLGVTVSLSHDRGFEDVRPTRRSGSFAGDWLRDRRSNRAAGAARQGASP